MLERCIWCDSTTWWISIFLGYVGSVLFNDSIPHDHKLFGFVLGTVILVLVGIWDDIKQIEPKTKLMGQIIAAAILVAYDIRVDFINLPWGGVVYLKYWAIPLTIFWIVGFTNIVNLIDGLMAWLQVFPLSHVSLFVQ